MSLLRDARALPPGTRALLLLNMLNNIGSGLVLPFLVVYVHRVNGLPLTTATSAVAVVSAMALVGSPVAGWLADRASAERAAALHMAVSAAGLTGYAFADRSWHFLVSAALVGFGVGGSAAWNTLLADSAPDEKHPVVFSLNFTCVNASIGLGGLVGGAVVSAADPFSFRALYLADALSCLVAALLVARRGRHRSSAEAARTGAAGSTPPGGRARTSYAVVLRSPAFVVVLVTGAGLFFTTYAQLEAGLPAFLTTDTALGADHLAVLFAVNTGGVIGTQVLLHQVLTRLHPAHAGAAAAALWSVSWLFVLGAGRAGDRSTQFALLITGMVLFAVAETFYAAGIPTLVNSLAPPGARGRFNAAYGMSTSTGYIAGPLAAGVLVGGGRGPAFITALAVACGLLALLLLSSRIWLPGAARPGRDGRRDRAPQPPERTPAAGDAVN
ncbi:MFS transporter [Actinacidiphila glaucinigra]|uniref:MFS transporter n=1 Tax=Actinacidiphila glaucinigra TaxID=235986 RepID=UPI0036E5E5BD